MTTTNGRILFGAGAGLIAAGLAVAISPLLGMACGIATGIGLGILRDPRIGVFLIAAVLPLERIGALETGDSTIRLSQVLVAVTLVVWAVVGAARRRLPLAPYPIGFPVTAFLAVNLLGLLVVVNLHRSLVVLGATLLTIAVSALLPMLLTDRASLYRLVRILLISAAVVSVFGLLQFFGDLAGLPTTVTGLRELYTKDVLGFPRIQSTALEPLYFANYLLLPIGVLLALYLSDQRRVVPRPWLLPLLLLLGVNLMLTVSRGGYLGLAATALVVGTFSLRHLITPTRLSILLLIGFVTYVVVVQAIGAGGEALLETFTGHVQNVFFGASFAERVETIEHAVTAFWSSPWVGIGPGAFGPFVAMHPFVVPKDGWAIVNNEYIELLAETGIAGTLAFVGIVTTLVLRSLRAIRRSHDHEVTALLVGVLGAFIGILVQYLTFSTLYIMHVWFVIGLLIAVQTFALREHS